MVPDYDSDDYELLPHEEIEHLREEVSHLRKNPFKDRAEPVDLQSSVDKLTLAIEHLTKILSSTNDEMIEDFKKTSIQENFNIISSQNEKIAEGILTVAQLIQAPSSNSVQEVSKQVAQPVVAQEEISPVNQAPVPSSQMPMPPPVNQAPVPSSQMPMPPPVNQAPVAAPSQTPIEVPVPPTPGQIPPPTGGINLPPPPKKSGFNFFKK